MAISTFEEKIRVNNPKVLEEYVAAMDKAVMAPVRTWNVPSVREINDPEQLIMLMQKGIEKWGKGEI